MLLDKDELSRRTLTQTDLDALGEPAGPVESWRLVVMEGGRPVASRRAGLETLRIGAGAENQLVVADKKVSRHHLDVELHAFGVRVKDRRSKNGTYYQHMRIDDAELPATGGVLRIGDSDVVIRPDEAPELLELYPAERCGGLVGRSAVMRSLYAEIAKVAPTESTVLITGETGTGKELVAAAIHSLSSRASRGLVVLDCASIARELIESALFGHVRGAFTGAVDNQVGAFESANRSTLVLDEIGELELALQPKLLRVLEAGTFRRVGGTKETTVNVRVVAATHQPLTERVQAKHFREDLYFRLQVMPIQVPPLRDHLEDLPLLVEHFLAPMGAAPLQPGSLKVLAAYPWPGNIRQLRNVLERAAALAGGGPIVIRPEDLDVPDAMVANPAALMTLPYRKAKDALLERFTRDYLTALLERHDHNVSAAARAAKLDRNWLMALSKRYGVPLRP